MERNSLEGEAPSEPPDPPSPRVACLEWTGKGTVNLLPDELLQIHLQCANVLVGSKWRRKLACGLPKHYGLGSTG